MEYEAPKVEARHLASGRRTPFPNERPDRGSSTGSPSRSFAAVHRRQLNPLFLTRVIITTPLVDVDLAELGSAIGTAPLRLRHRLAPDERFETAALIELADTLPAQWTRVDRGDVSPLSTRRPVSGTNVGAVISSLATSTTTVRLYHLELAAGYRELGDEVLSSVDAAFTGASQPTGLNTAVFFGPPGAVVPAHIDRHHNLLLQLRGTKRVSIGRFAEADRHQREVERDFDGHGSGAHRAAAGAVQRRPGPWRRRVHPAVRVPLDGKPRRRFGRGLDRMENEGDGALRARPRMQRPHAATAPVAAPGRLGARA